MADTPATAFTAVMTKLTGNQAGALESLPDVTLNGAKVRAIQATIAYASQAAGTVTGIARVPLGAALLGFLFNADTSSGSTTLALGSAKDTFSAKYTAAAALTSTDTPTWRIKQAQMGVAITTGYDCVTVLSAPYEDIILTMAAATAPASGNLTITTFYVQD